MGRKDQKPQANMFRCKRHRAPFPGAPAKPSFRLCGERRGGGMSELSPKAKAKDMELAPTMKRGFFAPRRRDFRHKILKRKD